MAHFPGGGGSGGGSGFPDQTYLSGFSAADHYTNASNVFLGEEAVTIYAIIRPRQFQGGRQTYFGTNDAGSAGGLGLELDANAVRFVFGDGGGSLRDLSGFLDSLPIRRWLHVAGRFVSDGVDTKGFLYVNGTQVADGFFGGVTGGITGGGGLFVGARGGIDREASGIDIAALAYKLTDTAPTALAAAFEQGVYDGTLAGGGIAWDDLWEASTLPGATWAPTEGASVLTRVGGALTSGVRSNPLY